MRPGRAFQPRGEINFVNRHGPDQRAEQHAQDQQRQHGRTHHRELVLAESAPRLGGRRHRRMPRSTQERISYS